MGVSTNYDVSYTSFYTFLPTTSEVYLCYAFYINSPLLTRYRLAEKAAKIHDFRSV